MLKSILPSLLQFPDCQGSIMFVIGAEGSGKTTLARAIANSHESAGFVPFSTILSRYVDEEAKKPNRKDAVELVRKKMAKRKKDISHSFLCSALRYGLTSVQKSPLVVVEGFLRRTKQCQDALQLVGEFFPHHLLVVVEAVCDFDIAHQRAVDRKQHHDKAEFITECHREYKRLIPEIRDACDQWAHMLTVNTSGSEDDTLQDLIENLEKFVGRISGEQHKKPAVFIPALVSTVAA